MKFIVRLNYASVKDRRDAHIRADREIIEVQSKSQGSKILLLRYQRLLKIQRNRERERVKYSLFANGASIFFNIPGEIQYIRENIRANKWSA